MALPLLPCPHCACHAKSAEVTCPCCGEPLRRDDGTIARGATAVLLGLAAAGAIAASCGGTPTVFYGPAQTTSSGGGGSSTSGSTSGATSSGGAGGQDGG